MPLRETELIRVPSIAGVNTYVGEGIRRLHIDYVSQRPYLLLCWAASGQMAFSNFGKLVRMCELAGMRSGEVCCSAGPMPAGCDQVYWPHLAYDRTGMAYKPLKGVLDEASLRDELFGHDRPVQLLINYPSTWHTAVVVGMAPDGDFLVHDPWFGAGIKCGYALLRNAYGTGGVWRATYWALDA